MNILDRLKEKLTISYHNWFVIMAAITTVLFVCDSKYEYYILVMLWVVIVYLRHVALKTESNFTSVVELIEKNVNQLRSLNKVLSEQSEMLSDFTTEQKKLFSSLFVAKKGKN